VVRVDNAEYPNGTRSNYFAVANAENL